MLCLLMYYKNCTNKTIYGGKERNKMQKNTPNKRKNIRLKEYDYSTPGYYFVTICTQNRKEVLSKIINSNKENVGAGPVSARKCKINIHRKNNRKNVFEFRKRIFKYKIT